MSLFRSVASEQLNRIKRHPVGPSARARWLVGRVGQRNNNSHKKKHISKHLQLFVRSIQSNARCRHTVCVPPCSQNRSIHGFTWRAIRKGNCADTMEIIEPGTRVSVKLPTTPFLLFCSQNFDRTLIETIQPLTAGKGNNFSPPTVAVAKCVPRTIAWSIVHEAEN